MNEPNPTDPGLSTSPQTPSGASVLGSCVKTEELGKGILLEMVAIPSGTFRMGSPKGEGRIQERPQCEVTVPPFFMGKYPITQAQWWAIAYRSDLKVKRSIDLNPALFDKNDRHPVERVSWYDAVEFCDRLSRLTGRDYRLPSEVEWEYACRAGTTSPFYFGEALADNLANYREEALDLEKFVLDLLGWNEDRGTTWVGKFPPNGLGLHDMHGNVKEWCANPWYENYRHADDDGSAWVGYGESLYSAVRGGSWDNNPISCRSASRERMNRSGTFSTVGFRVACNMGRTLSPAIPEFKKLETEAEIEAEIERREKLRELMAARRAARQEEQRRNRQRSARDNRKVWIDDGWQIGRGNDGKYRHW